VIHSTGVPNTASYQLDRLGSVAPNDQRIEELAKYIDGLIKMKLEQAQGSDSVLTPMLREESNKPNYPQSIFEAQQALCDPSSQNYLRLNLEQIYKTKEDNPDPKYILEIINQESSKFTQKVNEQLNFIAKNTNQIMQTEGAEAHTSITPPKIEEKEESEIRAKLIEIFLLERQDLLRKVTKELKPEILEEHKEKIFRAVSLFGLAPEDNPTPYLKVLVTSTVLPHLASKDNSTPDLADFRKAVDELPSAVKDKISAMLIRAMSYAYGQGAAPVDNPESDLYLSILVMQKLLLNCKNLHLDNFRLTEMNFSTMKITYPDPPLDYFSIIFSDASMRNTNLTNSIFGGQNLQSANLEGANLTNTDLRGANLIGAKLSGAYWEEGRPPLIDRRTQFIPDWFYKGRLSELPLSPMNEDFPISGLLGRGVQTIANLSTALMDATSWFNRGINTITELALPSITKKVLNDSSNDQRTKTIQEAFKEVTPEMKDHILKNIGLSQRRALEAILAHGIPDTQITAATDISLILPQKPALIIMPDEQAANLEAGLTANNLIQEETPQHQSVNYNLAPIKQQAALKNLTKVSGDHTKKDFSKLEITLFGALFDQARLDSANLSGKDLSETVFNECRLIKTNLSGAKLQNTIFNNCDLSKVNLSKAEMQGTTFHNCNLSKSTWEKALMDGVTMINCTIKNVDIEEMSSHNWFLDHCILDNVNFKGSEEGKGIFINQMGLVSSIIINSNIEGNTNFHNIESIGSVLAIHDPAEKLLNNDLSLSPLSYVNNSPIQIALEAVFQKGSIYSKAFQDVKYNGINFGPVDLMNLSGLSQAAIGYQPQRFINVDPKLLESMK
jgi:uncharacterized protein YjbI with pentapeptide repeats